MLTMRVRHSAVQRWPFVHCYHVKKTWPVPRAPAAGLKSMSAGCLAASQFPETGTAHSLFCRSRGTSAFRFGVRSRDVGAFAVVFASIPRGGRRFFQLRGHFAPHFLLLRAVSRMWRVLECAARRYGDECARKS